MTLYSVLSFLDLDISVDILVTIKNIHFKLGILVEKREPVVKGQVILRWLFAQ